MIFVGLKLTFPEERKKLYEYLIGEEKKLEMIKYIQNLLTKRKEKCTEIHNI